MLDGTDREVPISQRCAAIGLSGIPDEGGQDRLTRQVGPTDTDAVILLRWQGSEVDIPPGVQALTLQLKRSSQGVLVRHFDHSPSFVLLISLSLSSSSLRRFTSLERS